MTNYVTIEGRDLKRAMKIALDITEMRNTIPILSHVRLRLGESGFHIVATDLDIEAVIQVDAIDHSDAIDICINARRLYEIASAAGTMRVLIKEAENGAEITLDDNAAFYTIVTLPADEFPMFDWKRTTEIEAFSNGSFAALLDKVKFCISTETTRYYLGGIAWHISANDRYFAATDGHKLAACRYSKEGGKAITRIIPRKAVRIIGKHLAGKDVKIFATESAFAIDIATPGLMLRTKLIDGTFPDWKRVVPASNDFTLKLKREEITTAIIQATAIGGDRMRAVKFTGNRGRLVVERKSPDFGKALIKTSSEWPEKAQEFGLNTEYFRMMAANCQGEISLEFTDAAAPVVFKDADDTMTRVLMPMRV